MTRILIAAVALAAYPALTQDPPKEPKINKYLKPVSWLIGTWEGKGNMMGTEYEDEYRYTWALNNNFLKHEYWMRINGKVAHYDTGMMGWDRDKKKLVGFTFGQDGSIGYGEETQSDPKAEDKSELVLDGKVVGNDPFKEFRAVLKRVDDDTMTAQISVWKEDKYVPYGPSMTYRRKKE